MGSKYEIYKDYDGNTPDIGPFFLVPTEKLARNAVKLLEELRNSDKDGCLSYIEGFEWCARWRYRVYNPPSVFNTVDKIKEYIDGARAEYDDDDEDE